MIPWIEKRNNKFSKNIVFIKSYPPHSISNSLHTLIVYWQEDSWEKSLAREKLKNKYLG